MNYRTVIACTFVAVALTAGCAGDLPTIGPYGGGGPLPNCAGRSLGGVEWVRNGFGIGYEQNLEIVVGESATLVASFGTPWDDCLPSTPTHYRFMSMTHGNAIGTELASCTSCLVRLANTLQIRATADTPQTVGLRINGLTPGKTELWVAGCTTEWWDGNESLPRCKGARSSAVATIVVRP